MPDVRYVILSDLHFGAENSVLTDVMPDSVRVDPSKPGAVMEALVECLGELVGGNEGRKKPTLILGGDVLELALAEDNVAAMVFQRFVELTMCGHDRLFADTVYFVPGNHDHHLWEGARERRYAEYVASVRKDEPIKAPSHTTRMFIGAADDATDAQLLTALIRSSGEERLRVRTIYPNLGVLADDGSKALVFHHGHFIESMYRLMSIGREMAFDRSTPNRIHAWEAENFAWIDFFWSTLGRSGDVGVDVGLIYDSFKSTTATDRIVDNLANGIAGRVHGRMRRALARRGLRAAFELGVGEVLSRERRTPSTVLSTDARSGLSAYLEGPLRTQLVSDCDGDPPAEIAFAFGHTHKPFVETLDATGYPSPVPILNTGGWVVDGLEPEPLHGAGAVLVDERANPLLLRFFTQRADASDYRVEVQQPPGAATEFGKRVTELVDPAKPPWSHFSKTVAGVVRQRNRELAEIISRASGGGPA